MDQNDTLRPELLIVCGLAGILGSLAPTVANVIAATVAEHDFTADTISDLARGPHKWIMDTGFYIGAAGYLGLAVAAAHLHLGRVLWSLSIFALLALALVIVLLGVWDDFHTEGNNPPGMTVHTKLTFALGPLYVAGPLLMVRDARRVNRGYGALFVAAAFLWLIFAAAFKLAPNGYDGLLEKIAVLATLLWSLPLAWLFLSDGRRRARRRPA